MIKIKNPYIETENEIMTHLVSAYNLFSKLESTHPSDREDFTNGIHELQKILGMRILRRDYPNVFPSYCKTKTKIAKMEGNKYPLSHEDFKKIFPDEE